MFHFIIQLGMQYEYLMFSLAFLYKGLYLIQTTKSAILIPNGPIGKSQIYICMNAGWI